MRTIVAPNGCGFKRQKQREAFGRQLPPFDSEVDPLWQCDLELIRLVSRFSLSTSAHAGALLIGIVALLILPPRYTAQAYLMGFAGGGSEKARKGRALAKLAEQSSLAMLQHSGVETRARLLQSQQCLKRE